jgi:hypothetical protein
MLPIPAAHTGDVRQERYKRMIGSPKNRRRAAIVTDKRARDRSDIGSGVVDLVHHPRFGETR